MTQPKESPTKPADPGEGFRAARADQSLQDAERGVGVARDLVGAAIDEADPSAREEALFKILWTLDRVAEGMAAASEFVQRYWTEPERSAAP